MKYKIGEVSRILGTSADLLRYYEKKGVVTPEKDCSNDYRWYQPWDINFLTDCLWFKNFGFSIEQVANIVKIPTVSSLNNLFLHREDELRDVMEHCRLLLKRSEMYRKGLNRIQDLFRVCEICDSPELTYFIHRIGGEYITDRRIEGAVDRWLHAMPFNNRFFEIGDDNFTPGSETEYKWGYCLSSDFVRELDFKTGPEDHVTVSRRSIHTVFKNFGDLGGFQEGALQFVRDYAQKNGYTVTGRVYGILLASVMQNNRLTGYFEVWIPIE